MFSFRCERASLNNAAAEPHLTPGKLFGTLRGAAWCESEVAPHAEPANTAGSSASEAGSWETKIHGSWGMNCPTNGAAFSPFQEKTGAAKGRQCAVQGWRVDVGLTMRVVGESGLLAGEGEASFWSFCHMLCVPTISSCAIACVKLGRARCGGWKLTSVFVIWNLLMS